MILQVPRIEVYTSHIHAGVNHTAKNAHSTIMAVGSLINGADNIGAPVFRVVLLEQLLEPRLLFDIGI